MMYLQRNSSGSIWNLLSLNSQSQRQLVEKTSELPRDIANFLEKQKKTAEDQVF